MVEYYRELRQKYPIISIEDGMAEGDWDGWETMTEVARQQHADRRRRPLRHEPGDLRARESSAGSPTRF